MNIKSIDTRDNKKCSKEFKIRALTVVLMLFVLFAIMWPGQTAYGASNSTGTVIIDALNVRSGPGTLNESLGLVYLCLLYTSI